MLKPERIYISDMKIKVLMYYCHHLNGSIRWIDWLIKSKELNFVVEMTQMYDRKGIAMCKISNLHSYLR